METLAVPIIIGLVEVAKRSGLPSKWSALLALVLGVGMGIFLVETAPLAQKVVAGAIVGLAASGLYSGARAVME